MEDFKKSSDSAANYENAESVDLDCLSIDLNVDEYLDVPFMDSFMNEQIRWYDDNYNAEFNAINEPKAVGVCDNSVVINYEAEQQPIVVVIDPHDENCTENIEHCIVDMSSSTEFDTSSLDNGRLIIDDPFEAATIDELLCDEVLNDSTTTTESESSTGSITDDDDDDEDDDDVKVLIGAASTPYSEIMSDVAKKSEDAFNTILQTIPKDKLAFALPHNGDWVPVVQNRNEFINESKETLAILRDVVSNLWTVNTTNADDDVNTLLNKLNDISDANIFKFFQNRNKKITFVDFGFEHTKRLVNDKPLLGLISIGAIMLDCSGDAIKIIKYATKVTLRSSNTSVGNVNDMFNESDVIFYFADPNKGLIPLIINDFIDSDLVRNNINKFVNLSTMIRLKLPANESDYCIELTHNPNMVCICCKMIRWFLSFAKETSFGQSLPRGILPFARKNRYENEYTEYNNNNNSNNNSNTISCNNIR